MSRTHRMRLSLEPLERRETPAVTAAVSGGTLSLTGDNTANNLVVVETSPGMFAASANATPLGTFAATNIAITMGTGNDTVDLGFTSKLNGYLTASLGGGNDYLTTINSTVGATIGGSVQIYTGASTPIIGSYDEVIELYNLNFNGSTQVIGNAGSATSQVDVDTSKFASSLVVRNIYVTHLGNFNDPAAAPQIFSLLVDNTSLNTDARTDAPNDAGNVVFAFSGTQVTGTFSYNGGSGIDDVILPGEGGAGAAGITVGGSLTMVGREGRNTLSLGDGSFGTSVGGSVFFSGGAGVDRFFFDSGSSVAGGVTLNLGHGDNQLFGDSLGLGAGPFNPVGSASVNFNLTITLGNGNNFIGTYGVGSSLAVGGSFSITVGNGNNLGGDAFAPGAITVFNPNITVGTTTSFTAGTGSQTIEISNPFLGTLKIKLGGGANTVNFPITDFFGNATIDFGVGPGPKAFETDGIPTTFHGTLVLQNYP